MPVPLTPISASDDLVTVARAAQNAKLATLNTANPSLLASLITTASDAIRGYCHRDFNQAGYTEYCSGGGYPYNTLQLKQFPVLRIDRLAVDPCCAVRITNASGANQRATVATTKTGLRLSRVSSGVSASIEIAFTDYPTITALASAVIAAGNGWAAVSDPAFALWASTDLRQLQGAYNAIGGDAELVVYSEDLGPDRWELDADSGILSGRFPQGVENIRVDYTAGFDEIPADIQQACVQMVLDLYNAGRANANLKSWSMGPYGETNAEKGNVAMSGVVRGLLNRFIDQAKATGGL